MKSVGQAWLAKRNDDADRFPKIALRLYGVNHGCRAWWCSNIKEVHDTEVVALEFGGADA